MNKTFRNRKCIYLQYYISLLIQDIPFVERFPYKSIHICRCLKYLYKLPKNFLEYSILDVSGFRNDLEVDILLQEYNPHV